MAAVLSQLLLPQVVTRVVSLIRAGRGPLGSWLGFQPESFDPNTVSVGGPNMGRGAGQETNTGSVRNFTYRIFNNTRVVMKMRAPGTGPGTVAQNPMGVNTVSICRFHQKIPLSYEMLGNLSPMVGPNSQIDQGGQSYIGQQTTFLAQQGNKTVEMMAAGMMRDSLYMIQQGENWLPSFTAPTGTQIGFQVPFQIPSGNKNQLNMLGTGNIINTTWSNPGAPILSDIQQIVAAYAQLSGYALTDIWINSTLWMSIITNTQVRNTGGSSNTPFASFDRVNAPGMGSKGPSNTFVATLKGNPTIRWHMCDDVVALGTDIDPIYSTAPAAANLAKLIPDNMAIFSTEPSKEWTTFHTGGEYVVENPGMPGALRQGWYAWHEYTTQPSMIELICLLNGVPVLYVPSVMAPATVIF